MRIIIDYVFMDLTFYEAIDRRTPTLAMIKHTLIMILYVFEIVNGAQLGYIDGYPTL